MKDVYGREIDEKRMNELAKTFNEIIEEQTKHDIDCLCALCEQLELYNSIWT